MAKKEVIPELNKIYYFRSKTGKTYKYKYIGTKDKYYCFEFFDKIIKMTHARFNYLYDNKNMDGIKEQ